MSKREGILLALPAVEVVRVVGYPIQRVWNAWMDPQKFAQWWVSDGMEATEISADVRVGGAFRWGLRRTETGDTYMASGKYLEIEEPTRFVLSWDSEHNGSSYLQGAKVTISLRDLDGDATEIRILHEQLEQAQQCSDYSLGWAAACVELARFLGDGAPSPQTVGEARRSLRLAVEIDRPASEIWPWLVEPERLASWFPHEAEMDARAGGSYSFRWRKSDGNCHERSGAVTLAEQPLMLDMEWFPTDWDPQAASEQDWREAGRTIVSWRLNESGTTTLVSLSHHGWHYGAQWDEMFNGHAEGWQEYVTNLREVLEGRADIR